jgi:hypothetical protein
MYLAIDNERMQILAVESTADDVHDCEMFDQLIDSIPGKIDTVMGDGAYGTIGAYKKCHENGIELVAAPKSGDVVNEKATEPHIIKRNKQVDYFQKNGIHAWANRNDYWARNRVETTMSRYVTTFTDRLSSRNIQAQKNEIVMKCPL